MVVSGGENGNVWLWFLVKHGPAASARSSKSRNDDVDSSSLRPDVPSNSAAVSFKMVHRKQLRGHTSPITLVSGDAFKAFSSSVDGTHKLWQADGNHIGRCMCTLNETSYHGPVSAAKIGATFLALGHEDGLVSIFQWGTQVDEAKWKRQRQVSGKKKKKLRLKSRSTAVVRKAGSNRRWLRDLTARCNDDLYGIEDLDAM